MTREPFRVAGMGGSVIRPLPATELVAAIVSKGLMDLCLCVHDKGAILRNRFVDGSALQQKQLGRLRTILEHDSGRRIKGGGVLNGHLAAADDYSVAVKEVQPSAGAGLTGGQCPRCVRRHLDRPDHDSIGCVGRP